MNDFVWTAGSNPAIERQIAMTDIGEGTAIGMSGLGLLESTEALGEESGFDYKQCAVGCLQRHMTLVQRCLKLRVGKNFCMGKAKEAADACMRQCQQRRDVAISVEDIPEEVPSNGTTTTRDGLMRKGEDVADTQKKKSLLMYGILGAIVLILIVLMIALFRKKR